MSPEARGLPPPVRVLAGAGINAQGQRYLRIAIRDATDGLATIAVTFGGRAVR